MSRHKTVTILEKVSGDAADAVQMGFHWNFPGTASEADKIALMSEIHYFFNQEPSGHNDTVGGYIAHSVSRSSGDMHTEIYDIPVSAGPLGSPVAGLSDTLVAGGPGSLNLPEEVAVALSFRAEYGSLVENLPTGGSGPTGKKHPRARRRNRTFIGPLNTFVLDGVAGSTNPQRVITAFRQVLVDAAAEFLAAGAAGLGFSWSTFSQVEWAMYDVSQIWVDDAFDTQRRRGVAPISRTSLSL
jgi:hypothetical protein